MLGFHHILSGQYRLFLVQSFLFVAGCILLWQGGGYRNQYLDVCCYRPTPPTASMYAHGGSCANPRSPIVRGGDAASCTGFSVLGAILISTGVGCFFMSLCVFLASRPLYSRRIIRHLAFYMDQEDIAHDEEREDEWAHSHGDLTLRTAVVLLMLLYPVQSFILWRPLYEAGLYGRWAYMLFLTLVTFFIFLIFYAIYIWEDSFSCYTYYKFSPNNWEVLSRGLCSDPDSEIYKETQNGERVFWPQYYAILVAALVSGVLWLVSVVLQFTGLGSSVKSFTEAYIHQCKQYAMFEHTEFEREEGVDRDALDNLEYVSPDEAVMEEETLLVRRRVSKKTKAKLKKERLDHEKALMREKKAHHRQPHPELRQRHIIP